MPPFYFYPIQYLRDPDPTANTTIIFSNCLLKAHPDNALILSKWEGENSDRTLIGLAQLLQEVRESGVEDVRDVLSYYRQYEDPVSAFR